MTLSNINPDGRLRALFGDRLYAAGQALLDGGCVRDVRVLQAGRVVTGIAAEPAHATDGRPAYRIFIQRPHSPRFEELEAECSCGTSGLCAHVVAVSIAAVRTGPHASPDVHRPGILSSAPVARIGATQQHLYYLFEDCSAGDGATDSLQVSLWVGQTPASGGRIDTGSLGPFTLRAAAESDEFPRYVEAQDKAILRSLAPLRSNGPWRLHGDLGVAVLKQAVATGRAFRRSFQGTPLQPGRTRQVRFFWQVLPDGNQRLRAEAPSAVHIALSLDPPVYIDESSGAWGAVQTPYSIPLVRAYASRSPITPEEVAAVTEQIAKDAAAAAFPKPRAISIRSQALAHLAPKLVLSGAPGAAAAASSAEPTSARREGTSVAFESVAFEQRARATLHFVYNGLDVDSRALRPGHAARRMSDELESDVCWEVARDPAGELRLRAELDRHLPGDECGRDEWLAFMMTGAPELQAHGWTICVEDGFPYRIVIPDGWYTDLSAGREDSWFDLRLGVMVEGKQINLLPAVISVLQSGREQGNPAHARIGDQLMIRLEDGRYLPAPLERIERIAHTLVELHEQGSLGSEQALPLPASQASRVAQLSAELNSRQVQVDDERLRALIAELRDSPGIPPVPAPAHFRATLRPYQHEGLGWLQFLRRFQLGGVLADDMGLGKTVQTLAHLALEKAEGRLQGPSLIVAPVSVIGNWQQELRRFAPELSVLTLHGARRKELFTAVERADVVITGYSLLQVDSEMLLGCELHFLILDEAQMIKNPRTKVAQVARALRARYRLCLTGTPMENHLGELWSLFDFLQPGFLGDEREFQRRYRTPIEKDGNRKRAQALTRRIAPFILRRTKEAVARELPPKTQIVEPIVLEERQRDFYDGIRLAMHRRVQEVIQEQGLARSHITVVDALLKLRQACCDPRLVRDDAETRTLPSAKLDWLRTSLPELAAEGRRILLFSQFTSMLKLIEAEVSGLSIPYCLLTGETQQRAEVVQRFQSGAVPLFLISLKAGGVGLNLTAADTVIHYDPWWNPAVESQATDRAHRIGQDQPVFVYKLIAAGTVEEKIMQMQADKHALATQLYEQHAAGPAQWSGADIEALFAP